jgi:hypothetical protein
MKLQGTLLESTQFEFSQDGNCVDTAEYETLKIRCESSLGIDRDEDAGNYFFVLSTKQWSINSVEELDALLDRIRAAVDFKNKKPNK